MEQKPHYEPLEGAASSVIGCERIRLPVAAKIALHSAGDGWQAGLAHAVQRYV
jgi:hypothetical protein